MQKKIWLRFFVCDCWHQIVASMMTIDVSKFKRILSSVWKLTLVTHYNLYNVPLFVHVRAYKILLYNFSGTCKGLIYFYEIIEWTLRKASFQLEKISVIKNLLHKANKKDQTGELIWCATMHLSPVLLANVN